jgi:hypothetical protein
MNRHTNRILRSAIIALAVLLAFGLISFKLPKYKLLIYATINDSLFLKSSDTAWLTTNICLELQIDTINTSLIKNGKNKDCFLYKNNSFLKTQLYDLNDYEFIKNFKIRKFTITHSFISDAEETSESNCLNNKQIRLMNYGYRLCHKIKEEPCKIYFCDIIANDNTGREIRLQDICWNIIKR